MENGSAIASGDPGGEEQTIATGEARGVEWRLFLLPASSFGGLLCLEAGSAPPMRCAGSFEVGPGTDGPRQAPGMGLPTASGTDPVFVFGSVGEGVTRVVVELESTDPVRAEIVGEARAHYVVALPAGASPVEVVAYSASGEELARSGFMEDGFEQEPTESWERCGETERGYMCEGGASGSARSGGSGSVEE